MMNSMGSMVKGGHSTCNQSKKSTYMRAKMCMRGAIAKIRSHSCER